MAFSSSRLVLKAISRTVNSGRQFSSFKSSSRYLLKSSEECQTPRTLSRSMWNLCTGSRRSSTGNRGDGTLGPLACGVTRVSRPSKTCSCGCKGACLHTEADSDLVNFLKEEIEVEQDSLTNVPKVPGFEVTVNDADIKLTRDIEAERITVRFNINHSVEMEGGAEEGQEEAAPEMRSYPDFNVEVSKGGANSLRISCAYQRDDVLDDQEVDAEPDDDELFLIDEVLFAKEGASTDTLEGAYRVGSEVMNGDLYDHLKNYLAERGINKDFCEKLSDLSSAVEHRQYIGFLNQLQGFVKK
ncbi:complement component 1 Q subcomponent-binding protein, mitochondrial [Strongylocentrotus purpuratus]|uniref:Complement component 1 Q subcomponent-binding protein, mitochondrial n=1 Tax=Strongylocentrotus purpuratus TaxID=7668 RepID=A0A7M7RD86_STRPU|nr:complement component 1 Q subcomponent-binding protein, mitochondrial [Strongylocentrotus purpuratus]|eukprot:XP_789452.2 PREDICTED: complement component 1 Q subcomponent-binding protein, mitochondrial [Strongylocentrotus purpuratus]